MVTYKPIQHPGKLKNISGQRFGRFVVVELLGVRVQSQGAWWLCRCDCGTEKPMRGTALKSGNTKSCGCQKLDQARTGSSHRTHGMFGSPEYSTWANMIQRCSNPKSSRWVSYGGRGITVCKRWRDSFDAFFLDMGRRPSTRHQLDRRDNDGNYEPGNVRWVTRLRNMNNRSVNRWLTFGGRRRTIAQWARSTGLDASKIRQRLDLHGWSIQKTLTTP